jgi:uncharacterized protein (TIGR00255 family)
MNPACSMTGFASATGDLAGGTRFTLTIKSVNHRFLDMQFRMPPGLDGLEIEIRRRLKDRLKRGHISVALQVDDAARALSAEYNRDAALRYVTAMRAAARELSLSGEPTASDLLRMPGVWTVANGAGRDDASALEAAVREKIDPALEALLAMRATEGASLAAQLSACMERLDGFALAVYALRDDVRSGYFERLRGRIAELTAETPVDPGRILAEAAVMAERSDVEEELGRLRAHAQHFRDLLGMGGELGKKLDFLLQELNREANTMLSKTGGIVVGEGLRLTELGLDMKAEIEKARELVQNLE